MAGMLPGVEAARRRRCHQKSNVFHSSPITSGHGSCSSSTRRYSFSLYATATTNEFHLSSSNSFTRKGVCDESSLGAEAREAKKRLDERLQPPSCSSSRTSLTTGSRNSSASESRGEGCAEKKKRLRWLSKKMRWKKSLSEQEECAVCLEQLKAAPPLMQLPCGHSFHKNCLLPWLEANAHCPCCRTQIPPSIF